MMNYFPSDPFGLWSSPSNDQRHKTTKKKHQMTTETAKRNTFTTKRHNDNEETHLQIYISTETQNKHKETQHDQRGAQYFQSMCVALLK